MRTVLQKLFLSFFFSKTFVAMENAVFKINKNNAAGQELLPEMKE